MKSAVRTEFGQRIFRAKQDPAYFARVFLGIIAFPYQEEFLQDSGRTIAAACGRQVGKTTISAIKGLHFAFFNSGVTVLIISSTLRQSMLLFAKIRLMVESCPLIRMKLNTISQTTIEFDHSSRIIALPCGPTGYSLRGHTADMVILDEANFVPEEVVDGVIRPMLIAKPDSRFIMISTPWSRAHPFYRAISQKQLSFHVYSWPTSLNPLVSPEQLKAEKKNVDELTFQREYEAQFVEDSNCYFPRHLILQCVDGEHELLNNETLLGHGFKGDYYLGVDFGKRVDHTALAVLEQSADNVVRLVYLKQLPLGTQYTEAIGWIKRLNEAFQFSNVRLDQTGVGEAPIEEVKKFLPNAEGVILSARMKLELLSKLLLLMQNKQLILPLDRELIAQINGQQYQMSKTGELLFSHPTGSHDDQLWALAFAAWGLSSPRPRFLPITRSFGRSRL